MSAASLAKRLVRFPLSCGVGLLLFTSLEGCKKDAPAEAPAPSASAASAPPPEPKMVSFQALPARIGAREKSVRKTRLAMQVEFWQDGQKLGENESIRAEEYERETEVLGLVGGTPAKVKVKYLHHHLMEQSPEKPKGDSNLLEGHTYVVDATDQPLKVTNEKGKAAGVEEAEDLKKLHGDLGTDDALVTALGTAPIPVGKTVTLRQGIFRALIASGNGEMKGGTIVLSAVRAEGNRDAAVFDWKADMKTEDDGGLEMTWHLTGQAVVGLSPATTLRTKVEATIDAEGHTKKNGAKIDLTGSGAFLDERAVTPL